MLSNLPITLSCNAHDHTHAPAKTNIIRNQQLDMEKKGLRIAFAGASASGKTHMTNELCNMMESPYVSLSIQEPRVGLGTNTIVVKQEERLKNKWIGFLKKKLSSYSTSIHVILDDIKFNNEVAMLTTLGFKIVFLDIPWNVRYNRMVEKIGTDDPVKFTEKLRWFGYENTLSLPKYMYDFILKNDQDVENFWVNIAHQVNQSSK